MQMSNSSFLLYFLVTAITLYCLGLLSGKIFPSRNSIDVPIVKAPSGLISGTSMSSRKGRNIFGYRAIPYAEPPIGDLR